MAMRRKAGPVIGLVLHVLVGGLMIFAGAMKLSGKLPPDAVEAMNKSGVGAHLTLIGAGELIAGVLLIVPLTSSLGVLATSGFWGGVICFHLTHNEPYLAGSVFLALTWLCGYLRNPGTLASFQRPVVPAAEG